MKRSKSTISDVAEAAGVTIGTVDRVLHERGEVSEKTKEKVLRAVRELGYKTNVYASMLARNESHRIAVIMPMYSAGEFWDLTHSGISQSADYAGRFSVDIVDYLYDQYDVESFLSVCREAIVDNCSAAVIAPMFLDATCDVAREMEKAGLPYIILNTSVDGVSGHLAYYGQPIYDSGVFCADVLMSGSSPESLDDVYMVRIERDTKGLSDPSKERRRGFMDYLSVRFPGTRVRDVVINPKDPAEAHAAMDVAFEGIGKSANIVTLNSRIYLVSDFLRERGLDGLNVVGFDVLEKNISALKDGYVKYLIAQHSDREAMASVITLTDYLVFGKRPRCQDNFSSIDLLSRYNYRFY